MAAAVAGLALLAAAGCSSSGSGHPASGSAAPAAPKGIQAPAKIASLKKVSDHPGVGSSYSGIPKPVLKKLHSAFYADAADGSHTAAITGGPGFPVPSEGPADKVKRLFSEWAMGSNGESLTSVPTGSVGGVAECTSNEASNNHLDCGWVNGNTALVISFDGFEKERARALVPQILEAMVRT